MIQEKANWSVSRMARLLQVPRSAYYKWADQQDKKIKSLDPREEFHKKMENKIWTF